MHQAAEKINEWSVKNHMKVNCNKTEKVIINEERAMQSAASKNAHNQLTKMLVDEYRRDFEARLERLTTPLSFLRKLWKYKNNFCGIEKQ